MKHLVSGTYELAANLEELMPTVFWFAYHDGMVPGFGLVDRSEIPDVLAMADVFVQPGLPGAFNDLRLPSKIPEFFAIGRPVVLPRTNVGRRLIDGEDAFILDRGDALSIYNALHTLRADAALCDRLAAGAVRVSRRWLKGDALGADLLRFYRGLL